MILQKLRKKDMKITTYNTSSSCFFKALITFSLYFYELLNGWCTIKKIKIKILVNVSALGSFNGPLINLVLGLVPLNSIVWYYVWLNVVINKVILLLSKKLVTWIFEYYHLVHEIHSMWFMWFSHRRYKSQVLCKLRILVHNRWWNWAFHL